MIIEKQSQPVADDYKFENIVENSVRIGIQHAIKDIDMCSCHDCQLKACAIALNALPTKYIITSKGSKMTEIGLLSQAFQFKIVLEVVRALKIVKDHPLHS